MTGFTLTAPAMHQPYGSAISETATAFFSSAGGANSTFTGALSNTTSALMSSFNGTGESGLNGSAIEALRRKLAGGAGSANGLEWLRGLLEKRQFRIPCVDVIVRL